MITPPLKAVRVTVPVSPKVLATFQSMADAGGLSVGKAMANWLADTLDAAQYVADSMHKARAAPKHVARELHAYALSMAEETGHMLDQVLTKVKQAEEAENAARRGPAGGEGPGRVLGLTPPSSNTGGKVGKKTTASGKGRASGYPLPPAQVQAHADTNGVPPRAK